MRTIAIVGGGLAGLACARELVGHGHEVVVLDKGRAPGGRLTGRRCGRAPCDLGASYFTAREPRFVAVVEAWEREGHCAPWDARIGATDGDGLFTKPSPTVRHVGVPSMLDIATALASGLDVRPAHRVDGIRGTPGKLLLDVHVAADGQTLAPATPGDAGRAPTATLGPFGAVAVCLPAPQASSLLAPIAPGLAATARSVAFDPCLVMAFTTDDPRVKAIPYDGVFVGRDDDCDLSWVARENSKPGREPTERWVVHGGSRFSRALEEAPPERATSALLAAFERVFALDRVVVRDTTVKRWRYARGGAKLEPLHLVDRVSGVGMAGDWTEGGRIEAAYLSGRKLAEHLLAGP